MEADALNVLELPLWHYVARSSPALENEFVVVVQKMSVAVICQLAVSCRMLCREGLDFRLTVCRLAALPACHRVELINHRKA